MCSIKYWIVCHYCVHGRVPTGSGKQGKQGKKNGQGKVREFYFGPKVREKSGIFFYFRPKVRVFFPESLNAAISISY